MSTYDNFAQQYFDSQGEEGDFFHKTQIDPYIYQAIGNPQGKHIYDLGCGSGYISRNLAKKGAIVIASDVSAELIALATEKSKGLEIKYLVRDGVDFSGFKKSQFDVVVMNMVIHYIEDLDTLFSQISKVLKKNGVLVFSTNHFFRPTYPYSEWTRGQIDDKERLFIKVTNYLESYHVKIKSYWDNQTELTIINRPLNKFISAMSKYNLYINNLYEPDSDGCFASSYSEELRKSHYIPTYVIFDVKKL
jgi:ubiquinone/menaquinone biosynthesis C-methylase UbiE